MTTQQIIQNIRQFNRDYTKLIGVLDKHVLKSPYTLTESRFLLEIGTTDQCSAKAITEGLDLDAAFVSRTIGTLIQKGLVIKQVSSEDKRAYILKLTQQGQEVLEQLNQASNQQMLKLIDHLSPEQQSKVVDSMDAISHQLLGKEVPPQPLITIRHTLKPGDAGRMITMHGELYSKECGYS